MKTVYVVAIACGIALGSFLTSIYYSEINHISQIFRDEYNLFYFIILITCIWMFIECVMGLLRVKGWRAALIVCCGALLFSAARTHHRLAELAASSLYALSNNEEVTLACDVTAPPDIRTNKQFITCKAHHILDENNSLTEIKNLSNIRITLSRNLRTPINHRDTLILSGKLKKPEAFITETERTFNYDTYLLVRGVTHTMYQPSIITHQPRDTATFQTRLFNLKTKLIDQANLLLPAPESGLLAGILYGDQRGISENQEKIFRDTGIIHIVVLSGYNVTLVIIFVHALLKKMNKRFRLMLSIIAALTFMVFTGMGSTIVRATIMAILTLLATHGGGTLSPARNLALAAAAMILINPLITAWDLSFQLSFLATVGLIYIGQAITPYFRFIPTYLGMRENAVATISTQITVMPLLLYSIGELSLLSPIVNMLVLPFVAPGMLIGFVGTLVTMILPASIPVVRLIMHIPLVAVTEISSRFASIPWVATTVPPIPTWMLVLCYVLIGAWMFFSKKIS